MESEDYKLLTFKLYVTFWIKTDIIEVEIYIF